MCLCAPLYNEAIKNVSSLSALTIPFSQLRVFPQRQPKSVGVVQARVKENFQSLGQRENRGTSTRQRGLKGESKWQARKSYEERYLEALKAELDEEMNEYETRVKEWSQQQLEEEGFALFQLTAVLDGSFYRSKVIKFVGKSPSGILPPHHQFSPGDMVAISKGGPLESEEDSVVEGIVLERANRFLRVAVKRNDSASLDLKSPFRLDLTANAVTYERCVAAVGKFSALSAGRDGAGVIQLDAESAGRVLNQQIEHDLNPTDRIRRATGWELGQNKRQEREKKLSAGLAKRGLNLGPGQVVAGEGVMSVWGIIMRQEEAQVRDAEQDKVGPSGGPGGFQNPVRNPQTLGYAKKPPPWIQEGKLGEFRSKVRVILAGEGWPLNGSQLAAIEAAMCRRLTIWQGPPGTGKTSTLLRYVRAVAHLKVGQVLACADSNVAADNIVEGLLGLGLKVVRIGHPAKVKASLRECTLEAILAAHPLSDGAREMRGTAMQQRKDSRDVKGQAPRQQAASRAARSWEKAILASQAATMDVLDRADVIVSTCVGAGDPCLAGRKFSVCVVDECTQATEPSTLIPLVHSLADSVLLVGDPCQLPPTVISREALHLGLGVSLYERLQQCQLDPYLLDTQYRMHPAIAEFSSRTFYGGRLLSHPRHQDRVPPRGFNWPSIFRPMCFINVDGKEQMSGVGASLFNESEAKMVLSVVQGLLAAGGLENGCESIGIISPYNAQVRLLLDSFRELSGGEGNRFEALEIKSVDGFQGREKEVIIVSTVRANADGILGFTTDPRRMNVAITRAKRGLIVIGHRGTLRSCKMWNSWLRQVEK